MAEESRDCSEIAKVPGSSAWTSLNSDPNHTMAKESHNWIRKIVNINVGKQGDIVMGVGGDFIKDAPGNIIKDAHGNIIKLPRWGFEGSSAPKSTELFGGLTSGRPWDDGINDGIREITLVYGKCIDSISVAYDKDGQFFKAGKRGGFRGFGSHLHDPYPISTVEIKLDYPNEFLVGVSGSSSTFPRMEAEVIRLLKFESNRRSFGPFGVEEGIPFSFRVKDGEQIVGLKGTYGWFVDAIGFHISRAPQRKLSRKVQERLVTSSELYGGLTSGRFWDDGINDGVRKITLVYGKCIESIRVAYEKDGQFVEAEKHGGFRGCGSHLHEPYPISTIEIKLEYPGEFLVGISGFSSTFPRMEAEVLRLLKFESNRRSFGPFGVEEGIPFSFRVKDGEQIVGLKGTYGWFVDAIGFHISHSPPKRSGASFKS